MVAEDISLKWVLQPILDTKAPGAVCAEALVRGQNSDGEEIRPDQFILLAEQTGRIYALDQWMNLSVLQWMETRLPSLMTIGFISVNLSAKTISSDQHMQVILSDLSTFSQAVRERICYEITETARIDDMSKAQSAVGALQYLGARVALDDFGTGYAHSDLLQKLPVDIVKVSRAMPTRRDISTGAPFGFMEAIQAIHLAGTPCVIEYVESERDIAFAKVLKVRYLQGYALAKPMTPAEFIGPRLGALTHRAQDLA